MVHGYWQALKPDSLFKPKKGQFHVIQLDFSMLNANAPGPAFQARFDPSVGVARQSMIKLLVHNARWQHGIDISDAGRNIYQAVQLWVWRLTDIEKKPVVILVDEYNSLVVHAMSNPKIAGMMATDVLEPFFSATKSLMEYIHKVFVTGVSDFGWTSIFYYANHYQLLLEDRDFYSLYGFTEAELRTTYVTVQSVHLKLSRPERPGLSMLTLLLCNTTTPSPMQIQRVHSRVCVVQGRGVTVPVGWRR